MDARRDVISRLHDMPAFYDLAFGPMLHQGRVAALRQMDLQPGDRVLEIGVGTGLSIPLYPSDCNVIGIDLSEAMLVKAREQIQRRRARNVEVLAMDACDLAFPGNHFDIVFAPYVISVVDDPVVVAREMARVCRPSGRLVFLGHFQSQRPWLARLEQWLAPSMLRLGLKTDLDLAVLLDQAGLDLLTIEKVNWPPVWSLVTCRKS